MASLTRRPFGETIRKLGPLLLAGLLGGCATPGPNHVYLTHAGSTAVHDAGPPPAKLEGALAAGEQALGLAYDFNTDHLFVRVSPGQFIRVIERPSGKVLREMPLPADLHATAPADIAIRSSDRHLFVAHPDGKSVVELTLFGQFVRHLTLSNLDGTLRGLAYDQKIRRLLVLSATPTARLGAVGLDGKVTYFVTFAVPLNAVSLAYDSEAQHSFVPLRDGRTLGEFDATGQLLTTQPVGDQPITALDAGPRSLVRIF